MIVYKTPMKIHLWRYLSSFFQSIIKEWREIGDNFIRAEIKHLNISGAFKHKKITITEVVQFKGRNVIVET